MPHDARLAGLRADAVLVTGASSGIGRALALALARPGAVLHLGGRDTARLDAVCAEAAARGADARPRVLDVTDREAMAAWIGGAGRLDLAVANAGISAGKARAETAAEAEAVFATNLLGAVNTAMPALALMQDQPPGAGGLRGRIAVIASIAAFFPSPASPAYCASKAAADRWTLAAAPLAARRGVAMTSVCPGFVRTAMTAGNRFPMPGIIGADEAARAILRGIASGRRRVVFPRWMGLLARGTGLLPARLTGALAARFAPDS